MEKGRVHREVTLVDRDAEATEDGPHGAAVFEGLADDAERGEVEDDAVGARVGSRRADGAPGAESR